MVLQTINDFGIETFFSLIYYLKLTVTTEVLWIVLPLALATLVMVIYFEKYREEKPGWDTHVSNSLVLLFVSITLLRAIYEIGAGDAYNYIDFYPKTLAVFFLLVFGSVLFFANFEHLFPKKIAEHLSSPLTVNLFTFIIILFVYSHHNIFAEDIFALLLLLVFLLALFNLIRWPLRDFFVKMKKMKEKEKAQEIMSQKKGIEEKKKSVEKEQDELKKVKKELTKEEKKERKKKIKDLDKQKKEIMRLKKLLRKANSRKKSSKKKS